MKKQHKWIIVLVLLLISVPIFAQNPFTSGREATTSIYLRKVPAFIVQWSRWLQDKIALLTQIMQSNDTTYHGFLAFLVAVVFGMVHVAGPGHGKIFTFTYFGSQKARLREGIALSALINVVDSISAGALVLVGYGILSVVFSTFREDVSHYLRLISYGCLTIFALYHLISHTRSHTHDHGHQHPDEHSTKASINPWILALSVGMVPCPVSTMLLIFGVANNVVPFSILLVIGVSLGGFITLTILSGLVIAGKTRLMQVLHGSSGERSLHIIEIVFSSLMVGAGALLFIASLV